MAFTKKPLKWNAVGVEPSEEKKIQGFGNGEYPAAGHFDFKFNSDYEAIKELQEKVGEVKTINGQSPDEKGNIQVDVDTNKLATKQSVTEVSNALTTHQADEMKHLTNGFLKINNGLTNFLLKMDAEGLYLEEV